MLDLSSRERLHSVAGALAMGRGSSSGALGSQAAVEKSAMRRPSCVNKMCSGFRSLEEAKQMKGLGQGVSRVQSDAASRHRAPRDLQCMLTGTHLLMGMLFCM